MNPQVGVTAMIRLNKKLKYLNKEITDLKKAKIKSDEEIIDLKKQIIDFKEFSFSQFEILNNKIEEQKKDQQKKGKELDEAKSELMVKYAQIEDFCLLALNSLKSIKEYLLEDILRKYINGKNLISEYFYPSYDCFLKIYKELVKKNKSSFYNLVVPFINSEKDTNCIEW